MNLYQTINSYCLGLYSVFPESDVDVQVQTCQHVNSLFLYAGVSDLALCFANDAPTSLWGRREQILTTMQKLFFGHTHADKHHMALAYSFTSIFASFMANDASLVVWRMIVAYDIVLSWRTVQHYRKPCSECSQYCASCARSSQNLLK